MPGHLKDSGLEDYLGIDPPPVGMILTAEVSVDSREPLRLMQVGRHVEEHKLHSTFPRAFSSRARWAIPHRFRRCMDLLPGPVVPS